jgi:hypothetical protein
MVWGQFGMHVNIDLNFVAFWGLGGPGGAS